ncbi:MAG: hypothetical protein O3A51_03835 [Verrucomicrobia bacterium]|nr:hypothetical protein [Verrucomicrobiota bacterium]
MLTCRQVSKSLENGDFANLTWYSRLGLKLHVALCIFCGRYNRQRMIMYDGMRKFLQFEAEGEGNQSVTLPDRARQSIKTSLQQADQDPDSKPDL